MRNTIEVLRQLAIASPIPADATCHHAFLLTKDGTRPNLIVHRHGKMWNLLLDDEEVDRAERSPEEFAQRVAAFIDEAYASQKSASSEILG